MCFDLLTETRIKQKVVRHNNLASFVTWCKKATQSMQTSKHCKNDPYKLVCSISTKLRKKAI